MAKNMILEYIDSLTESYHFSTDWLDSLAEDHDNGPVSKADAIRVIDDFFDETIAACEAQIKRVKLMKEDLYKLSHKQFDQKCKEGDYGN